jgi:hypothetical protein
LAAVILLSAQVTIAGNRPVKVCLATQLLPFPMQSRARAQASAIYAKIGVDLKWSRLSECADDSIRIDIEPRAGASVSPMVLARAYPFEAGSPHITIFLDRVQALIEGRTLSGPSIMGHVLAHEIGHILLRTDAHANTGLMKARWTSMDLASMPLVPIELGDTHAKMIQENLDRRALTAAVR